MKGIWVVAIALASAGSLAARNPRQAVEVVTSETVTVAPGGTIRIDDSFGELHVEGWEREDVELRVSRRTQWRYAPEDEWKARQRLERITVEVTRWDRDLNIKTRFPRGSLFWPLGGRANLDMRYDVKVPRRANLRIRHSVGAVNVQGVDASIDVINKVGEVSVRLPEGDGYSIDAHAKVGDVDSSLPGKTRRSHLVGASFDSHERRGNKRVHVVVKVGAIFLGKWPGAGSGRR